MSDELEKQHGDDAHGKGLTMLAQETRRVLDTRKWSLRRAEIQTRVNYSTINNMAMGRNVRPEYLVQFAEAIGENPDKWLAAAGTPFRYADPLLDLGPVEATVSLPVIGRVAAGTPLLSEANIEEYVSVPRRWLPRGEEKGCYALTVRGNSMTGADIYDGDTLAVRYAETAEDGQVVVCRIGDEVTVKRYRDNRFSPHYRFGCLHSDPEDYMPPISLGPDAAIIGLPVGSLRPKPANWG